MQVVTTHQMQIADYVARKIPGMKGYLDWGPNFSAVGFMDNGRLLGAAVFTAYTGHDVIISVAMEPRGFTCQVKRCLADLVFNQWGCVRLSAAVLKNAKRMRRLMIRLGFREEGVSPLAYDGRRDLVRYGMLRKDCIYLRRNGDGS